MPEVAQPATQPLIYGGANPAVTNVNVRPVQEHQIYGGANPLENTQSIPIMNNTVSAPVQEAPVMQNIQ